MSELGVFAVDRGVFNHPLLSTREPYSRLEAWLWLLSEAAWKPRKVNRNGVIIDLHRGQLAHSIRFMAEAWGWSKSSVERFLTRLKTGTMIGTQDGTGSIVVTICKYDAYQRVGLPDRDSLRDADRDTTGTAAGQTRNIKSFKEDILSEAEASNSTSPKRSKSRNEYTPDYEAFWTAYPSTQGMTKLDGFKAWQQLTPDQQAQAMASIPAYKSLLAKNPDRSVKHVQGYLNGRMFESFATSQLQQADWEKRITYGRQWQKWPVHQWGPIPGQPGCKVPADLLQAGDGAGWGEARVA